MKDSTAWLVSAFSVLLVIFMLIATNDYVNGLYPRGVVVKGFDFDSDSIIFEDASGIQWWMHGIEDWSVGDYAALLIDSCGTEDIYDDLIVAARYAG